ncbi:MAG: hypothetical protein Q9200_004141 [Gallowayella weberi]
MSIDPPENHEERLTDVLGEQKPKNYAEANDHDPTEVLGEYEEQGRLLLICRDLEGAFESVREGRDKEASDQMADNLGTNSSSIRGHRSSNSPGADDSDAIQFPNYENREGEDYESQQSQESDFPSDQADNGSNYTQELPLDYPQSVHEGTAILFYEERNYFHFGFLDSLSNEEDSTSEHTHEFYLDDSSSEDQGNAEIHETLSCQTLTENPMISGSESDVDDDTSDNGSQQNKEDPNSDTDPLVLTRSKYDSLRERGSRVHSGNESDGDDDASDTRSEQGEGSQDPDFEPAPPYSTRNQRQASTQTLPQPSAQPPTQPPTTTTITITTTSTTTITTTTTPTPNRET